MSVGRSEKGLKTSKNKNTQQTSRDLAFRSAPKIIKLVFKLGFVYLSFKRKAKKAGKIFEKELLVNGIDKDTAKLLTEEYLKSSHFIRQFNISNMTSDTSFESL